jgi:hypothetical protein
MSANKFVLKGSGVEVGYTIGITPGLAAMTYTDGAFEKSFTANQIQSDDTGLAQLISVSPRRLVPATVPLSVTWRRHHTPRRANQVLPPSDRSTNRGAELSASTFYTVGAHA